MITVTTDIIRGSRNLGDTFTANNVHAAVEIINQSFDVRFCDIKFSGNNVFITKDITSWGMIMLDTEDDRNNAVSQLNKIKGVC